MCVGKKSEILKISKRMWWSFWIKIAFLAKEPKKELKLISFGSSGVGFISIDMLLFPHNLLFPHCSTWLTTLVGLWCPEHVFPVSGRMPQSQPWRQVPGAGGGGGSPPKGPSDPMNLQISRFSPQTHKWTQPQMQSSVSNKADHCNLLQKSQNSLSETWDWNSELTKPKPSLGFSSHLVNARWNEGREGVGQAGALGSSPCSSDVSD